MSCKLKEVTKIKDINDLLLWLCPSKLNKENWLDECVLAFSPVLDTAAIAYKNRLAILKSKPANQSDCNSESSTVFSPTWKGVIDHFQDFDEITSLLCLPIASQKHTSSGAPDWSTIIVGFKSGTISFYTENGCLLLSQLFDYSLVEEISVRTFVPKNFGTCVYSDLSEELLVLYSNCVVSIDGFSLLQTLKVCRNQVAKASAFGEENSELTSLGYKKYSLYPHDSVSSCCSCGMVAPHIYDYVMLMSNLYGFNQTVTGTVPTTSLLLTTGKNPFISSFLIKDSLSPYFIADVAIHYASKIKNALMSAASGWLFGSKTADKPKPKIEPPVSVPVTYSIPDKRRFGTSIKLSLNRRLAVVSDDFARVHIFDVQKGFVIRMLKGYRDASCGWIPVQGEFDHERREVNFLIVYAPKRNILEIWLPQQGSRIGAFNVDKNCKLFYSSHTFLGAKIFQYSTYSVTPVIFLNSDGVLKTIEIPFHLALSSKTSKEARDLHLVKSIKNTLKNKVIEETMNLIQELQTLSGKLQLLHVLSESKHSSLVLCQKVIDLFSTSITNFSIYNSDTVSQNKDLYVLTSFLDNFKCSIDLYVLICQFREEEKLDADGSKANLYSLLKLSREEHDYLPFTDLTNFKYGDFGFSRYIMCLNFADKAKTKKDSSLSITIRSNLSSANRKDFASFIFNWPFNQNNLKQFIDILKSTKIDPNDLLHLNFKNWLNCIEFSEEIISKTFYQWLALALLLDSSIYTPSLSEHRTLWIRVRKQLMSWNVPIHSLIASLIFRAIENYFVLWCNSIYLHIEPEQTCSEKCVLNFDFFSIFEQICSIIKTEQVKCEKNAKQKNVKTEAAESLKIERAQSNLSRKEHIATDEKSFEQLKSTKDFDHYEEFSLELVEWNLIIKKLLQVTKIYHFQNAISKSKNVRKLYDLPDYSLETIYSKGKGYLSEILSRCLIEANLSVNKIIDEILLQNLDSEKTECEPQVILIKESFAEVRKCFPESTNYDVMLVNLSWELAALWRKSLTSVFFYNESVVALSRIENAFLKHGISLMIWDTLTIHVIQNLNELMNKICKKPNDKICLRNVGISEFDLETFLESARMILEIILEANLRCEVERAPLIGEDTFWKNSEATMLSLPEVALAQKNTSNDLVILHIQLISVLSLVVKYQLRNVKPNFLFSEKDRTGLFRSLSSTWRANIEESSENLSHQQNQISFIKKVICASVVSLPDFDPEIEHIEEPLGFTEALELSRNWDISLDLARRFYVCQLYSSALDNVAEQALLCVHDSSILASEMLEIAGQRLRYLTDTSSRSIEIMALITPNLTEWTNKLDYSELRCPHVEIRKTSKMSNKVLLMMSKSSKQFKLAHDVARSFKMILESGLE